MQNPPNIDLVVTLYIEDNLGVIWNSPESKVRQVQLVGIARRTCGRVATDMVVSALQRIDEAQRCIHRTLLKVIPNRFIHIPISLSARDNRLYLHGCPPD